MDGVGDKRLIVDLDIVYHGDARVQISIMKVTAGVSDVHLKGKLRLILNLIDHLPLVGSVEMMFLQQPALDFDLEGAANLLDLPGVNGMLRQVVFDALSAQMVYPHRISLLITDKVSPEKMLLPKPLGVLSVSIVEASNLPQTDFGGFLQIDPYCILQFGSITLKTKKSSGSNPKWNEVYEFPIDIAERQSIMIDIFDSDSLSEDEHLGQTVLDVKTAQHSKIQDLWINLNNSGKLHLKTTWYDILEEPKDSDWTAKSSKVLSVYIGKVSVVSSSKALDRQIKVTLDLESESLSSKTVAPEEDGTTFTINESFLSLVDKHCKRFTFKVIDTEEAKKLGQTSFEVEEVLKMPNCQYSFGKISIGDKKVSKIQLK